MFKSKIIVSASLSLTLLLASTALAQDKDKPAATRRKPVAGTHKGKQGRYANQEVSYRKKGADTGQPNKELLPYIEQDNLNKTQPKQQGILPYVEHSNVRSRKARKRR